MSVDYMNMHIIFNLQMIKNHCMFCKKQLLYYYIFKTLRFKSELRTIIYIILVKFCLYISLFVNVFQIHSIVMLLFGIIVITYVFHLFIWFISTHSLAVSRKRCFNKLHVHVHEAFWLVQPFFPTERTLTIFFIFYTSWFVYLVVTMMMGDTFET